MRLTQFLVVNMPLFGPGLRVAPSADPSDGLLDVVALDVIPFERLPS
jgi:diacylglycerol kinase family enzyme